MNQLLSDGWEQALLAWWAFQLAEADAEDRRYSELTSPDKYSACAMCGASSQRDDKYYLWSVICPRDNCRGLKTFFGLSQDLGRVMFKHVRAGDDLSLTRPRFNWLKQHLSSKYKTCRIDKLPAEIRYEILLAAQLIRQAHENAINFPSRTINARLASCTV